MPQSGSDEKDAVDVNVGGTRNVLEACSRHGVRQLIHCSRWRRPDGSPGPIDIAAGICLLVSRGLGKLYYQVRNRWFLTLSVYSGRTLLLLAPAVFVYELSLMAFVAAKGGLRDYARASAVIARRRA